MTLKPAPINTGYVFRVTKVNNKILELKADFRNVKSTQLCTLLSDKKEIPYQQLSIYYQLVMA